MKQGESPPIPCTRLHGGNIASKRCPLGRNRRPALCTASRWRRGATAGAFKVSTWAPMISGGCHGGAGRFPVVLMVSEAFQGALRHVLPWLCVLCAPSGWSPYGSRRECSEAGRLNWTPQKSGAGVAKTSRSFCNNRGRIEIPVSSPLQSAHTQLNPKTSRL